MKIKYEFVTGEKLEIDVGDSIGGSCGGNGSAAVPEEPD